MDNKVILGDIFVSGRIVKLDTVDISELERYIIDVDNLKQEANFRLKKIATEIENI